MRPRSCSWGCNTSAAVAVTVTTYVDLHWLLTGQCPCCEAKKMEERAEEMNAGLIESTMEPAKRSLTPAEAFIHRQMQVAEAKEQIASLCTAVISSPEDDVI